MNIGPLRISYINSKDNPNHHHPQTGERRPGGIDALTPSACDAALARCSDRPAHSGARDVPNSACSCLAVPRPVRDAAEIHGSRLARRRDPRGGGDIIRDPERAHEVTARAAWDHGHGWFLVEPVEAVDDLVNRAVAADDDEQLGATLHGLPGELSEMTAPLAEERVPLEPDAGRHVGDLRPAAPGRAVRRCRIHEEDGVAHDAER